MIETYLLDFAGDLYDTRIDVKLFKRLRGEVRFESLEKLREQVARDEQQARAFFGKEQA